MTSTADLKDNELSLLVLTSLFPVRPGGKLGNFVFEQVRELARLTPVHVVVTRAWLPRALAERIPDKASVDCSAYRDERFTVETLRYFSLPKYRLGTLAAGFIRAGVLPRLRLLVRKRGMQVIHAHGTACGFAAQALRREFGIPYVVTIHGQEDSPAFADTEAKRRQIGTMLDEADRVVLVGSPLRSFVAGFASRTDNFTVVPNGFRIFEPLEPSARFPKRAFRIVTAANLDTNKGIDLLLRAVADCIKVTGKKMEVVVVGDGPQRGTLQSLARDLDMTDSVHFTGFLSHHDTEAEIFAGDVFCLPAWREAFGVVYLEAMALGRPTIGCRGQGPSDFMVHNESGYLVEPRSAASVSAVLQQILSHPEDAARVAEAGQRKSFAEFTWRHNAEKMLNLFHAVVEHRKEERGAAIRA